MKNIFQIGLLAVFSTCAVNAQAAAVQWTTGTGANNHWYEVIASPSTPWIAARTAAQGIGTGWDLATITSMEEQNFIVSLLGPANGRLLEYYIGGTYDNGAWKWITNEPFSFTYWGSGEPNGNAGEPYLALDARYNLPNWGWNDYTGSGENFILGYVAEKQVPSVPIPAAAWLFGSGLIGLIGMRKKVA